MRQRFSERHTDPRAHLTATADATDPKLAEEMKALGVDTLDHHYRRYTKATLRELVARAGGENVEWVDLYYFNAIATFGWFLKGRVLKETKQADENWSVMNAVLPVVSRLEKIARPPFGLSLIAILKRR